jgi:hypothetical protein
MQSIYTHSHNKEHSCHSLLHCEKIIKKKSKLKTWNSVMYVGNKVTWIMGLANFFSLIHSHACSDVSHNIVCQQLFIAVFMLIRSNIHVTLSNLMWRTEVFWDEMLCHWVNVVLHVQGLRGPSRNEHNWTFELFILCIVSWFINSVSTNKCTILYIRYFSINLLLYILVELPSSGSLHQCCWNVQQ